MTDGQISIRRGFASASYCFLFKSFVAPSVHKAFIRNTLLPLTLHQNHLLWKLCDLTHLSRFFSISTHPLYRLSSPTTAEQNSVLFLPSREYLQALFKVVAVTTKMSCFLIETRHQLNQTVESYVVTLLMASGGQKAERVHING